MSDKQRLGAVVDLQRDHSDNPTPGEIQKRNKRAIRAAILGMSDVRKQRAAASGDGASAGESKSIPVDPFIRMACEGKVVEPPYDMLTLAMLVENSSEVGPAIDAMAVNVELFGWKLEPRIPIDEDTDPAILQILAEERAVAENFFETAYPGGSFEELRERMRRDLEATGNRYVEFVEVPTTGELDGLNHLPAWTMRMTPPDDEPTQCEELRVKKHVRVVEVPTDDEPEISSDGADLQMVRKQAVVEEVAYTLETQLRYKRFRRYVQRRGDKAVWFKELGDPRLISCLDGEPVSEEKLLEADPDGKVKHRFTMGPGGDLVVKEGVVGFPVAHAANPVHHQCLYSTRSPYGLPRYIGHLFAIFGSRAADEINYTTFKNNNIPSMVVTVANGMLTDESVSRISEFVETSIASDDNYSKFLLLEAEPTSEGLKDPGTMRIEVKPLTNEQHTDALFVNYTTNNDERVRRAWRFPPIFVGKSDDFTGKTIEASRKLGDEQVFGPERGRVNRFFTREVLLRLGIVWSTFKLLSPNVTENEDLIKAMTMAEKTGGMTPRISRKMLGLVTNQDLGEVDADVIDPDKPFTLTLTEVMKDKSPSVDGSEPSSQGRTGTRTPSAGRDRDMEPANFSADVDSFRQQLRAEAARRFGGFVPPTLEDDEEN